jgi:NAD(P)-dependent dehydrogenase (short-subunit alcohol dehydrogenase family)
MQTVLVTGVNGPMGQVIAQKLQLAGWEVLGSDRHEAPSKGLVPYLKDYFVADFLDISQIEDLAKWVKQVCSLGLSLVNNAAYTTEANSTDFAVELEKQSIASYVNSLQINLTAPFVLIKTLAPELKRDNRSSIVNITSTYGLVGPQPSIYENVDFFNAAGYAASKGGLHQLTKYFATVLAPEIRVNSVAPGGIKRNHSEDFVSRYVQLTPLGRMNSELDVANAVEFLLSEKASYITGQSLSVDGGWTVW